MATIQLKAEEESYGLHRVLAPEGAIPQAAERVLSTPELLSGQEILIDVEILNLDSTSMKNLVEDSRLEEDAQEDKIHESVKKRIAEIVKSRGKMHNPKTDSGGVLVGRVSEIGTEALERGFKLKKGDTIIPLCSLTAIPLTLDLEGIKGVYGDQVQLRDGAAKAVIFSKYSYATIPNDFSTSLALSAIDVSRLLPQVERYTKPKDVVLVVGCGKAGLTAISTVRRCAPEATILAVDVNEHQLALARRLNKANVVAKVSATNARDMHEFAVQNTPNGQGADLVLSCVNVRNVEAGCILSTKERGTIIFFSMATNFAKACLGTDGASKDINLLIGGGVFPDAADRMYELLRQDQTLYNIFNEMH